MDMLEALDVLAPDPHPGPAAATPPEDALVAQPALDEGALQVLVARAPIDTRSAENMARLRERLARKRSAAVVEKAQAMRDEATAALQDIAFVSPSAARAVGVSGRKVLKRGKPIRETTALCLLRVACASKATLVERHHKYAAQVEATIMNMCQRRQACALPMLLSMCARLTQEGFLVMVGFSWEQDAAKMTLKSLGGQLGSQVSAHMTGLEKLCALVSNRGRKFQHGLTENIINMSGFMYIEAVKDDQRFLRSFHWHQAPLALSSGTTASLTCALRRMPLRVDERSGLEALAEASAGVVVSSCQDRASSNIAHSKQVHQLTASLGPKVLYDTEWCELHNTNNLRTSASDMVKLAAKYYSIAALMNTSVYASGAILRLSSWVEQNLQRRAMQAPDVAVVERNRRLVDSLFDLSASHHRRVRADGSVAKSSLLIDLEELVTTDAGDWDSDELICYCWSAESRAPRHKHINECRNAFVAIFYRVYMGSTWPLPSVTKFTNMSVIDRSWCVYGGAWGKQGARRRGF